MARDEFRRIKRRGIPIAGGVVGPMGELESNEWEAKKTAFPEEVPPEVARLAERASDPELKRLVAAIQAGLQRVQIQEPLETEDKPASTFVWNMYDNVGWNVGPPAAPMIQRVDSVTKNRVSFWCFSCGVPAIIIWLTPGEGVQAAFGALPGMGIPMNPPSAVGVYDGYDWGCQIGDGINFFVSSGAAGARLVVVEGVRA